MSDKITVEIEFEGDHAKFSFKNSENPSVTKHQVSSVLRGIAANIPDGVPGEQPVYPVQFTPNVLAALLFTTDAEGNVTLALHENQQASLRIAFKDIASSIHEFADQMSKHA